MTQCVSLENPNHVAIILDEVKSLTGNDPTRIDVEGLKEPIARLICFMTLRVLTRVFESQGRLEVWASIGAMTENINTQIAREFNGWQREELFWSEYARRGQRSVNSDVTDRYYYYLCLCSIYILQVLSNTNDYN